MGKEGAEFVLATPAGNVTMAGNPAGVRVIDAPEGARTAQTLYYSWSAFFPDTKIVEGK